MFSFSRHPEKMVFPKNLGWNMIFLILSGKMIFLFPENMIFPPRRKMKDDLSKKYTEIWYFLQMLQKDGLFRKDCAGTWNFLYYLERWYFFPPKTWYSFLGRKARSNILHEIRGDKMFRVYTYGCYKRGATLLCQKKNQRWSYPAKIHLKVIEFLDWHPRKSASNSLCFHGDLYRRFHILLSSEKKQET